MDDSFVIDLGPKILLKLKDIMKHDMRSMCIERELGILKHSKINYHNRFKPAAMKLFNRAFAYKENEDYFWAFRRHIVRKNSFYTSLYLSRLKTTKGSLYFSYFPDNGKIQCFTAHLFDRYRERNRLRTRDEAIKKLLAEMLMSLDGPDDNGLLHTESYNGIKDYNVILAVESGLLLGNRIGNDLIFKTYLTKSMLNADKLSHYNNLRNNR